ncbi:hypothetical protein CGRA01v4_09768 [Colletotrichum graminicola]|nr:hypothetical protein CGRA01v4_09768 [Colletotrichum graminicola]
MSGMMNDDDDDACRPTTAQGSPAPPVCLLWYIRYLRLPQQNSLHYLGLAFCLARSSHVTRRDISNCQPGAQPPLQDIPTHRPSETDGQQYLAPLAKRRGWSGYHPDAGVGLYAAAQQTHTHTHTHTHTYMHTCADTARKKKGEKCNSKRQMHRPMPRGDMQKVCSRLRLDILTPFNPSLPSIINHLVAGGKCPIR